MTTPSRVESTRRRDTESTERTPEERAETLVRTSRDPHFAQRAKSFFASSEFRTLGDTQQSQMLEALEASGSEESVDRLQHLATDEQFRAGRTARWTGAEVRDAVGGEALDADSMARSSGAERRERHAGPGWLGGLGGATHLVEGGAEVFGACNLAGGASGVGAVLFVAEALHGLYEAKVEGPRDATRTNYGIGFANELTSLTGGPPMPLRNLPGIREGASAARRVWDDLRPCERAILQSMSATERRDFHTSLTALLEARTIGGE